ncbi:hypothetical protein EDD17DRAFT_1636057 [Pisolithus thermaeus]|nr:hypothetical protein EDD17DRAFT_1636057 [Pisolithus thermaeus]
MIHPHSLVHACTWQPSSALVTGLPLQQRDPHLCAQYVHQRVWVNHLHSPAPTGGRTWQPLDDLVTGPLSAIEAV